MAGMENMKGYAIAIGALAIVTLVSIAVVAGFGTQGVFGVKANDTFCNATNSGLGDCKLFRLQETFITGLTIFATFTGVVVLALIGKIIVGLYKGD